MASGSFSPGQSSVRTTASRDLASHCADSSASLSGTYASVVKADGGNKEPETLRQHLELLWQRAIDSGVPEEALGEILNTTLDESSLRLAEQLRQDSARMLAEHAEIRRGFEERLQQRWRSALEAFEVVLVACLEVGSDLHSEQMAHSDPLSDVGQEVKAHAMTLLHARSCMVASEVFALLRTGHAAGAQARWRTAHEIAVISSLLGANSPDLSNRFLLHRFVERWKEAECYQQNCVALGQEPFSEKEMEQFRSDYDTVLNQFETGYAGDWGWAKPLFSSPKAEPNFAQLDELAGLDHNKPYVKLSHRAIHSGASGTLDILELYGQGEFMLAGPSDAGLAEPGHGCLIALYQVTTAYVLNAYGEDVEPDILRLS